MDCHEGERKPITVEVDGLLKSSLTEPPPTLASPSHRISPERVSVRPNGYPVSEWEIESVYAVSCRSASRNRPRA